VRGIELPHPTDPEVTIAIPTYNRADSFLREAMHSALNQTYQNFEIIVSDNCSSDNTELVVKNFQDPRIRYFKQTENIGQNNNCNFCLAQARGKYFMLLYDDDLIDSDFLEICINAMGAHTDVGVVLTGVREINANGKILGQCQNQAKGSSVDAFFRDWFANRVALYLCSTLYLTQALREIGGFQSKTNTYTDVVVTAKVMAKYQRADVAAVKASFRRHDMNLSSSVNIEAWCEDSLYLLEVLCELAPSQSAVLTREGMLYFCRSNYLMASMTKGLAKRLKAYWIVSKRFNHCSSLAMWLYKRNILPPFRYYPRRIWQRLQGM
jgi:glycosyltransferase involved in cell wall biosynthesis